jgi:hypothetical protein
LLLLLGREVGGDGPLPTLAWGFGRAVPALAWPPVGSAPDGDDDAPLAGSFGPVANDPLSSALDPTADAPLPRAPRPTADDPLPGPLDPAAAAAPPLPCPLPVDADSGGGNRETTSASVNLTIILQSSTLFMPRFFNSTCKRLSFMTSFCSGTKLDKARM